MSSDFPKINTLYLKLFAIQDISCTRQFTPLVLVVFFLILISDIFLIFFLPNVKCRKINLKDNNDNNKGDKIKESMSNALRINLVINEFS